MQSFMKNRSKGEEDRMDYELIIAEHPVLSAEQEKELGKLVQTGTESEANEAREKLVLSNIRLVIYFAKRYPRTEGFSLEDHIQNGLIGLMKAIDKYDGRDGNSLSTYASYDIRVAIKRAFDRQRRGNYSDLQDQEQRGGEFRPVERALAWQGPSPGETKAQEEELRKIQEKLTPEELMALSMIYGLTTGRKMSYCDFALLNGIPKSTAHKLVKKIKDKAASANL